MARALTKVDRRGKLYTRPGEVDTAIEVAIKQDLDTLARRAWISDPDKAEFLPMECLVHLLRDVGRRRDDHALRALMPPLLARCENVLRAKIPDDSFPNAPEIREDILGEFSLLLLKTKPEKTQASLISMNVAFFVHFLYSDLGIFGENVLA
jgi:hypothetical protein